MRSDMAKVIVERPRYGSRLKHRKGLRRHWQRMTPEDYPHREGALAHVGRTKHLNEHLGPLRRYLRKQVGRPWDKVFSEICRNLRVDSAVQGHVRDHVQDFVETKVIEIDGQYCHGAGRRLGLPIAGGYSLFYVCPCTGLLRALKRRKKAARAVERKTLDATHEARRMRGIWYEVTLAPRGTAPMSAWDVVFKAHARSLGELAATRAYGRDVYAVRMRPLSKREIHRWNLHGQRVPDFV